MRVRKPQEQQRKHISVHDKAGQWHLGELSGKRQQVPGGPCGTSVHWSLSLSPFLSLKVKVKSLSPVRLFASPWNVAYQAPPSMELPRQQYWHRIIRDSLGTAHERAILWENAECIFIKSPFWTRESYSKALKIRKFVLRAEHHLSRLTCQPRYLS